MTDRDEIFFENLNFMPPDDIITSVNPFRKALNRTLAGFALCAVTLNFFNLNYILPFVGMLLMLFGFRALKGENKWFSACFITTVFRFVYFCTTLLINTTIYHKDIFASPSVAVISVLNNLSLFALILFFGKALRTVQQKAGLPESTSGITALILWYAILFILALSGISGNIIAIVMIVALAFIIYSLYALSKELDEAGYTITPSFSKIPDWLLCSIICAVLVLCSICGYHFFGTYRMDWQVQSSVSDENIKDHLKTLGFPEEILDDLSESDLIECNGALHVQVTESLHPVNNGREVVSEEILSGRKTRIYSTVYDKKELLLTAIAVKLPKDEECWKIFHHFTWQITPEFYGAECIRIIPAYNFNASYGWRDAGNLSGHILYDANDTTFIAPYKYLGTQTHTADDMFFGQNTTSDIYATFSMPRTGTNHRGYVCYTTAENQNGWMLSSWINYTHKKEFFQYPNSTAMEEVQKSILDKSDAYINVSDAIQFFPNKITPTE